MTIEIKSKALREEIFIQLYESAFPKVAVFIHKMGGSLEEAKDIFHDALVIFHEKQVAENLNIETGNTQYLLGICKHLWYKKFKEKKITQLRDLGANLNANEEEPNVSEKLMRFVETSGQKCLDLLTAFYYEQMSMKALALKFGFSGERSATAQKFKCLEKVRTAIKTKSLQKHDFYE